MKHSMLLLIAAITVSLSAQAEIKNSHYEKRHQAVIEKAVIKQCFLERGHMVQINSKTAPVTIDNGKTDYVYKTNIEVHARVDQMIIDKYDVTVKSYYSDSYDHDAKDWGSYTVTGISDCVLR